MSVSCSLLVNRCLDVVSTPFPGLYNTYSSYEMRIVVTMGLYLVFLSFDTDIKVPYSSSSVAQKQCFFVARLCPPLVEKLCNGGGVA